MSGHVKRMQCEQQGNEMLLFYFLWPFQNHLLNGPMLSKSWYIYVNDSRAPTIDDVFRRCSYLASGFANKAILMDNTFPESLSSCESSNMFNVFFRCEVAEKWWSLATCTLILIDIFWTSLTHSIWLKSCRKL